MKLALVVAVAVATFSHSVYAAPTTVKVDGSSTVFPVTEAVAEEFQKSTRGQTRVTVGISGTGGGFKKFCRGETDVQNASRPISAEEMEACRAAKITYVELPIAFDAITVVVNPANDWVSEITVDELKKIWDPAAQGKITKWNQIRKEWPNETIKLYGAGADSGTFDYFTEAIVGKSKSSRGDFTASEDDNTLVQGISKDKFALGYLPYAYYEPNSARLKALAIVNGKGKGVLPSKVTVENGTYAPLSRPLFIYVNAKAAEEKKEVRSFIEFYLSNAGRLASEVKYVKLPDTAYTLATKHFKNKKLGTVFNGKNEVGLTIEELLKREAKI